MKARYLQPLLAAALALVMTLVASPVGAAEKAAPKEGAGNIASLWMIWVKDGQSRQFEEAIKSYAAWRKSAGETFDWSIYQPVVGADLDYYAIRSGSHHWKDMDTNAAWSQQQQAGARFEEKLGPYVKRSEHYFTETDADHSHWIDSKDYRYFSVSHYQMKPGSRGAVKDVLDKITKAVKDANWAYPYDIDSTIGGREGMSIIVPMKSYAEMADPDPSLMSVLAKSLGSKDAAEETMAKLEFRCRADTTARSTCTGRTCRRPGNPDRRRQD